MAERLRFILDGDDRLSPVLARAGDSSARLHRRLANDSQASSRSLRAFTRDANGQLRDLEGRFVSVAHASRLIRDDNGRWRDLNGRFIASATAAQRMATVTAGLPPALRTADRAVTDVNGRLRDARGRFIRAGDAAGSLGDAASSTAEQLGGKGGGLGGVLGGVAAIAGLSLLPALGAVVPMMAGAGLAAGTMKLGFSGVGDAMEAQAQGTEEYNAALKKLSPEARGFTKALVGLKGEFSGVGKNIQKAMLPGFTSAVRAAAPLVKILGKNMVDLGGTFGGLAKRAGAVFRESGFQRDLQANLTLGKRFVGEMASGVGRLGRSFLDFGAASKPTLTALSGGIRDVLGKGLPGMFDGLKTGISGSAAFLNGLFGMINRLLPALGRLSGEVARTFGPLLGEMLTSLGARGANAMDILGQAVKALLPVAKDLGFGFKATTQIMQLLAPTIKDVGSALVGSLLPSFSQVDSARGPLQRLSDTINDNKGAILEFARQAGGAFLSVVQVGVNAFPTLLGVFRVVTGGMVTAMGGVLHAAASAFGWIPGIGGKLKSADRAFQGFKDKYVGALNSAQSKADSFAVSVGPKLAAGKLKLNINNWQAQIEEAKRKLKTVPPSKQAALKATIADLESKVATARNRLNSLNGKTATTYVVTYYKVKGRNGVPSGSYGGSTPGRMWRGGRVQHLAGGGPVVGPGTGTSDSVPIMASANEFMVNARGARKHRGLLEAINDDRVPHSLGAVGMDVGRGLAAGMSGSLGTVAKGARATAGAIISAMKQELQIASPSKRTTALAKDVGKGLIKGLTGSKAQIKAASKDLAKDIWSAFTGSKDNRLVAYVNRETKKLTTLAGRRDSIASTIKRAKDFAETTRVGAKKAASLGGMFEGGEEVTASGINSKIQARLAKMKTFTSYIGTLAKRGLNKTMLREILDMGPEEGYAYASALAGSSSKLLKSINSAQYGINDQAEKLGRSGADALYDSGKNAGRGFLKGLSSQQAAIEKQMLKIAKGMDKAIRKALGIKSPSRVMAEVGRYSTEGLAAGLTERTPVLDRALGDVAGRVAATRPVLGRPAVAAGAGGGMNVYITVEQAMDPVAVGRELERLLTRLGRAQGLKVSISH
ncbi:hypothetical protein [Streptomyces sp. NPDC088785]|uniref:hypothetical protein n=1 Tax=Streptomyces sp. NPDC088785 TaxID=3365897 RepID=UPI00380CC066